MRGTWHGGMTVTLDVEQTGDVAVLRGVDNEAALAHLCRAVVTGSAFDVYRALVVDLDGSEEAALAAAEQVQEARAARNERRQWFAVSASPDDLAAEIARARQWLRLVDSRRDNPWVLLTADIVRVGTAPLRWFLRRAGR